jgi:glucokinase
MNTNLLGIDIGGTKCAVIYGIDHDGVMEVADKVRFETTDVESTLARILRELQAMCFKHDLNATNTCGVGISCGGPLDSRRGVVMSPPNLP